MEIKIQNMTNPPEKMRLMFEAVTELVREQNEISRITVAEITSKAGIGKGTAYEYFTSKEELIANALVYEYSNKLQALAEVAFVPVNFRDRVYRIMDWLVDNKEYNQMFTRLISSLMGAPGHDVFRGQCKNNEFQEAARNFVLEMIDKFMEEGYQQKAFTQLNKGKRSLALLTAMVEYSFATANTTPARYGVLNDSQLREFVYDSLIKSLS